MTINRWITPLLGLVLIISMGQMSLGQMPPVGRGFPPGGPFQQTMPVDVFGQQGFNPVNNASVNTSGFQSWMKPWPAVSLFENAFSETYWENGVWNRIQIPAGANTRKYYGNAGGMRVRVRKASSVRVGAVGVRTFRETFPGSTLLPTPGININDSGFIAPFSPFNMSVLGRQTPNVGGVSPRAVQQHNKNEYSPGFEMSLGFEDIDQGGGELSFFWFTGTDQLWERGSSEDDGFRGVLGSISIDDGNGGVTIPLDNLARIQFKSLAAGLEANLLNRPLYKSKNIRVRSTWGMKYMYIQETFRFEGRNSGDIGQYAGDGSLIAITTANVFPASAIDVESIVNTHLIGPQGGFEYSIGGESFKFGGHTKVGIMLNAERMALKETGLDTPLVGDGSGNIVVNTNFNSQRSSSDKLNSVHFSPLFEQNFYADMNVIHLIPVMKSIKLLDNAKIRLGYKMTAAWEVTRPYDNIVWQGGASLDPYIAPQRGLWYYDQLSASISWTR